MINETKESAKLTTMLARHGRLWQAVVATLLLLVHNFELTTAQCAEWFPLSISDDESDARCGIEDVSKTSMVLAVVVACACVLLCAVPAECVMAWKSHPKCNYMYPVNLGKHNSLALNCGCCCQVLRPRSLRLPSL